MGEIIQFKRPDGKTCPGYLATPKTGSSSPGFVCIQEWWGSKTFAAPCST